MEIMDIKGANVSITFELTDRKNAGPRKASHWFVSPMLKNISNFNWIHRIRNMTATRERNMSEHERAI